MFWGIIAVAALLAGCAVKPAGSSTFYYRGVYTPGSASVAEDGSFVSTSSVRRRDELNIAGEAALARLVEAARAKGLSLAVVASVSTDDARGHEYRVEGHLYRAGDAPADAVDIHQIEVALARHMDLLPKKPVTAASTDLAPREPVAEDVGAPIVIRAPDFAS